MRRPAALAALLLCLALVAGCGSGDTGLGGGGSDSTSGETSSETTEAAKPQVVVETAETGFDAAKVYREALPGVVTIRSIFDGAGGAAEGSGFVLDSDGKIVTNAHVVTDESSGSRKPAKEVFVEFTNRNVVPAKIVGFDPFADVALLEVKPDGLDLQPLELGDDRDIVVGEPVAAIGSPFGEQSSLSVGVVSAANRSVKSLTQFQIEGAIQTDASINPGNSGGPLLDGEAQVLGINQQIETSSGANDGVGFAVPVSAIKHSIAQLEEDGSAEYAYLGVSTQALYPQLADKLGLDTTFGGLLASVVPGGPAEKAGLEGGDQNLTFQAAEYRTGGDVILQIGGHDIVGPNDLSRYISTYEPGEKVALTILRDGKKEQVPVTLAKRPEAVPTG